MKVGKPPILRVRGTLRELQMEPITKERMWELFDPMISERDRQIYEETGGCDFSYVVVQRRRTVAVPRQHVDADGQPRDGVPKGRATRSPTSRGSTCPRSWRSSASSTREWSSWPA